MRSHNRAGAAPECCHSPAGIMPRSRSFRCLCILYSCGNGRIAKHRKADPRRLSRRTAVLVPDQIQQVAALTSRRITPFAGMIT